MSKNNKFDVVVIGGGHAGIEASTASARLGAKVALVSMSFDDLGQMSCNPAIGGLGKGHIVKEIDALDGVMGVLADKACIHFKMLNASKGAAVQGPRAQSDRKLYQQATRQLIHDYQQRYQLIFIAQEVLSIKKSDNEFELTLNNQEIIQAKSLVLTTGTFLNGKIHIGNESYQAGRYGSPASLGLRQFLQQHNLPLARLKTGTPPRLNAKTIDFTILEEQHGDLRPIPFSYLNDKIDVKQIPCYITHTNTETHEIIANNLTSSAMYSGAISGVGPRYCPSIEDKITKFKDKLSHQIFLEPEGLDDDTIYPNGISTSLSKECQEKFVRTIVGFENVEILRYGYAIEYDYINPQVLKSTLEINMLDNMFLAGQINGTTGYEEAAGQGLVAGTNAALAALNYAQYQQDPFVLTREESYIGVMIDDLVHHGVLEPYRMFTSRAEYRMLLRADNADQRLTIKGYKYNLVSQKRYEYFIAKKMQLDNAKEILSQQYFSPSYLNNQGITINQDGIKRNILDLLSFSSIQLDDIAKIYPHIQEIDQEILNIINNDSKYAHYIKQQILQIEKLKRDQDILLPNDLNYSQIAGLSNELIEKYTQIKPSNLANVMKIHGSTPSSVIAILTYLKKHQLI